MSQLVPFIVFIAPSKCSPQPLSSRAITTSTREEGTCCCYWDTTKRGAKPEKGVGDRISAAVCCLQPRSLHISGLRTTFKCICTLQSSEAVALFWGGVSATCQSCSEVSLFLVLLLSLKKQHPPGPKAFQCALYRETNGESTVGEEGGSRHKGRNPGTMLTCVGCYSLIRKKPVHKTWWVSR